MHFLHHNEICHRDLKLENFVFLDEEKTMLKIIDFGLSKQTDINNMESFLGTLYYVAPEILKNKNYNMRCDIWSLGVCLYQMLTGNYPYSKEEIHEFPYLTSEKQLEFPENTSPEAINLVGKLLKVNPES